MTFPLTDRQREAAFTTGCDLVVPAGAGAGKTRVLVERYLGLLAMVPGQPGLPVQSILAITFTNKAAQEMRARVRQAILSKVQEAERERNAAVYLHLRELLKQLDSAPITTIHSFCARLLRENPAQAGVDPSFTVLEEAKAEELLQGCLEDALLAALAEDWRWLRHLIEVMGFPACQNALSRLYRSIQAAGVTYTDLPGQPPDRQPVDAAIVELLEAGEDLARVPPSAVGAPKTREALVRWQQLWFKVFPVLQNPATSPLELLAALDVLKGGFRNPARVIAQQVGRFRTVREGTVNAVCRFISIAVAGEVSRLLGGVDEEYRRRKGQQASLDFTDLERGARDLLQHNPGLADHYRKLYQQVMVDEYQDTNDLQKQILDLLVTGPDGGRHWGKLFVVGDYKQSIYRFRGANVELFLATQREAAEAGEERARVVPLVENFRSQEDLISFINSFFPLLMPEVTDVTIKARRKSGNTQPCVEFLAVPAQGEDNLDYRQREAQAIARRIITMVAGGERLIWEAGRGGGGEVPRPVKFGDIALLFRAMTHVKAYERALADVGIPYYVVGGDGFYAKQEIRDILALLKLLVNPTDRLALAAVLRSPFCGVMDDTLLALADRGKGDLLRGFRRFRDINLSAEESGKLDVLTSLLRRFRPIALRLPVSRLLPLLLDNTGYRQVVLTWPVGRQAYANILKLEEMARSRSGKQVHTLDDFVSVLEKDMMGGVREREASLSCEGGDAVRLLSIHRSKGLEFPVVFLTDLSREDRHQSPRLAFSAGSGVVLKAPVAPGRWEKHNLWEMVEEEDRRAHRAETVRILYVGTTRARDYLVLAGMPDRQVPSRELLAQGRYTRWVDALLGWDRANWEKGLLPYGDGTRAIKLTMADSNSDSGVELPPRLIDRYPGLRTQLAVLAGGTGPVGPEQAGIFAQQEALATTGLVTARLRPAEAGGVAGISLPVTALVDLVHCPRRYYLSHSLGLGRRIPSLGRGIEGKLDAATRGTVIHRVCELLRQPEHLPVLVDQVLRAEGFTGDRLTAAMAEVMPLLANYAHSPLFQRVQAAVGRWHEMGLSLAIGNFRLEGVVDQVLEEAGGSLTVVDLKTNRLAAGDVPRLAEYYRVQAMAYAVGVASWLDRPVQEVCLYFMQVDQAVTLPVTTAMAGELVEKVEEMTGLLTGPRVVERFAPQPGWLCPACPHWGICRPGQEFPFPR